MESLFLVPKPMHALLTGGVCSVKKPVGLPSALHALDTIYPGCYRFDRKEDIRFMADAAIPYEGYRLVITQEGISVASAGEQGRFYALLTLGQLLIQHDVLPCCEIEDAPALAMRGYMLDISRGRIPTMETLFRIADLLAAFKYNQFQLYIEGFSFAYPSFPQCTQGRTPITGEEIERLKEYCAERCIELVPNQNCLGHMAPWLSRTEFRHLAEKEEGVEVMGRCFPPTTLNAADPDSLRLIERMTDDLLVHFDSAWFNVGMDEAFEIGKGKNEEFARQEGADRLFLQYAEKLHALTAARGKRMMMWADAVASSELLLKCLPRDILLLEWGYEAEHPYQQRAERLAEEGREFCICPGTSSWSSFTGITDNMLKNVQSAAKTAHRYGAKGLLMTDWGDMGHLQAPAVSWPGLIYAAALSWNGQGGLAEEELARALDLFVFFDESRSMGSFCLDAGRYYHREEFQMACRTLACLPVILGPMPAEQYQRYIPVFATAMANMAPQPVAETYLRSLAERKTFDETALTDFLDALEERLNRAHPACADGALIREEYKCAIHSVRVLTKARVALEKGERPVELAEELMQVIETYRTLWPKRSREYGLEEGMRSFIKLAEYFEQRGEAYEEKY